MTVSIEPAERAVRVVATAADGRSAERRVQSPDSLVATAIGLLLTIPRRSVAAPTEPTPPPVQSLSLPNAPAAATAPTALTLWAGLTTGLRLTVPTSVFVVDVEARADIVAERWLVMAAVRSAVASCLGQQGIDCDVYNDVSAGIGVGRRFATGPAVLDVVVAPSVVAMRMEYDTMGAAEGKEVEGAEVALRLDVSSRLAVPLSERWALTVTVDTGISPSLLVSPVRLQLPTGAPAGAAPVPPFPAWTGGVRIGASGALL
jgi:hypothetical protein